MEIDANLVALAGLLIGGVELRMAVSAMRRDLKINERRMSAMETAQREITRRLTAAGMALAFLIFY